jgi:preprotein translocase subunit SecF
VEVDTLFVTAFLTTMSYSVHDTIVVFDRIRELMKKGERLPFEELCDKAMTETVGRSTANSMTIVFMLLALTLLGGETIRWFVIALLIGTVSGTYSSPFVATPVLILWDRWEKRKQILK